MKKTILFTLFALFAFTWQGKAQAVNEPANWPNTNWVLDIIAHTGTDAMDIEANPTTSDDHFAYDDDDTGSGSHDEIAAESPVIDLTPAHDAGENYIYISGEYVYNFVNSNEKLSLDYWDADNNQWVTFYEFPQEDTPNAPDNNYCSGTPEDYLTSLDISGFTATQLNGFKYRIYYNDDTTGGSGYRWGFCFSSPTLFSSATQYSQPQFTTTINPDCANSQFSVDVEVTDLGGASSVTVSDDQGSTSQQLTAPGTVTFGPYADGTSVTFTVTNDDDNNYSSTQTVEYHCPPANDECDNAIALTLSTDYTCDNEISGTLINATHSSQSDYSDNYVDVWYTFTPSQDGGYVFVSEDSYVDIWSGDCSNLSRISQDHYNHRQIVSLTGGTTYYVSVTDYDDFAGDFNLCVYPKPPVPSNDACETATEISSLPYHETLDASGASNDGFTEICSEGSTNYYMNDGVWYKFTVGTASGDIIVTIDPVSWDPELQVYSGTDCNNLSCVDHIDDGLSGDPETITFTPTDNTTYYVNVGYWDSSDGSEGPFTIDITGSSTLAATTISANDFRFYPNPTQGVITWDAQGTVDRIQVVDLTGKVLIDLTQPQNNSLDISRLNQGVYLLNVQMGDKQGTYRIIKE